MAYTISEAALLSNDVLQAGVLEMFVKDDPILERLPFTTIVGNALTYNIELTEPDANFYLPNETWTETTGTVEQAIANLKILGGDSDVDNFILATRSNINDIKAEALKAKVKAVRKQFMTSFWYGYDGAIVVGGLSGREFNGVHALISDTGTNTDVVPIATTRLSYNTIGVGTGTGTTVALSMAVLERGLDKIVGFKPDLMVMTKQMRRLLNVWLRATAGGISYEDYANKRIQTVFGVPVAVSDYLKDNENCTKHYSADADKDWGFDYTDATVDDGTSIFFLTFDPKGVCGVQQGSMTTVPLGDLETKDASRFRIKWYVSLMLQNILSCSKITGLKIGAVGA